jgi:hypothetical protein
VLFTTEDVRQDMPAWEQKTAADSGISEDDRWQTAQRWWAGLGQRGDDGDP